MQLFFRGRQEIEMFEREILDISGPVKKWRESAENLGSTCVKYTEITEKTLVFPHIGQSIKSFQVCKSH